MVRRVLGQARTVVNVGAGAGAYEPDDLYVAAVEPSPAMRAQRPRNRPPAVDCVAEQLPFDDDSFDAAMAILTVHHWRDLAQGLVELRRVARGRIVIITFDPGALRDFWLAVYFPEVIGVERRRFPPLEQIASLLGGSVRTSAVAVRLDCPDGFGEAYYGRPEAFLDPRVRQAQSGFGLTDSGAVERGAERLRRDLEFGEWDRRYGDLRRLPERIGALRLLVARPQTQE